MLLIEFTSACDGFTDFPFVIVDFDDNDDDDDDVDDDVDLSLSFVKCLLLVLVLLLLLLFDVDDGVVFMTSGEVVVDDAGELFVDTGLCNDGAEEEVVEADVDSDEEDFFKSLRLSINRLT